MSDTVDIHGDQVVSAATLDFGLLKRLLPYAARHWQAFARSLGVLAGVLACELGTGWLWKLAIDGPAADAVEARAQSAAIDPAIQRAFLWIVAAYIGFVLIKTALSYLEVATLGRTGQLVVHDLRRDVFRHLVRLDVSWFDGRPTGSLVTRVTSDVENLSEMFTSGLIVIVFDLLKIVVILAVLFSISAKLALLTLLATPVMIAVSLLFRGGSREAFRLVRARASRQSGYLQEVLSGIRVVQAFGRERRVRGRYDELQNDTYRAALKALMLFALFFPTIYFVEALYKGGALWSFGAEVEAGRMSLGEFLQFWMYLYVLLAPIRELGERYNVLQAAFASAERLFQILDTQPRIQAPTAPVAGARITAGHVRFEDVHFHYSADVPVLRGVSFEIPPGRTVALVGATGAGKSTIVDLLLRFRDPVRGRITIDGVPLTDFAPTELRRHFGLVMQEDYLFHGTLRENLVMEREEVDEETLAVALEASRAGEVALRREAGLESTVRERGAGYSRGERQLLSIARALAGDPRIVVLDEATASVDSGTEAWIEDATTRLLHGRSSLVVAHRLSTVRRADRILVLHRGELRESGTHDQLLAAGGLYAKLYHLQFENAAPAADAPHDPPL